MTRTLIIRPEAEADIAAIYPTYDAIGHGRSFMANLGDAIDHIVAGPLHYVVVYEPVRRVLVRRYPFAVFYVAEPVRTIVLPVRHQAADPRSWPVP